MTDEEMAKECQAIADGLTEYLRLCLSSESMKKINNTEKGNLIIFHSITGFIASIVFGLHRQTNKDSTVILNDIIEEVRDKVKTLDEEIKDVRQIVKDLIDSVIKSKQDSKRK